MTEISNTRQGRIYDDQTDPNITLSFASYDDIDQLCEVINWAYRGKPSQSSPEQRYSGWISEQHLIKGARITPQGLKELIDDEKSSVILVAKLKTDHGEKIIGCGKVNSYEERANFNKEEDENDRAVEFGLYAVDPDYQSRGIGSLIFNTIIVIHTRAEQRFHRTILFSFSV